MKLLVKSLLNQPHMVVQKNITMDLNLEHKETVLGVFMIQLQQQFGSKMLNAPKIKVSSLVICV